MQINRSFIIILLCLIIGCKKDNLQVSKIADVKDTVSVQKQETATATTVNKLTESIVISCGSGCAMSYSPTNITDLNGDIKVKFKVKMYEDEVLTDTYDETYIFSYTSIGKVDNIKKEGEKGNFLETQMPDAQRSFIEFGEKLIVKSGSTNANNSEENKFIKTKKPLKVALPFSFYQYFSDDFSQTKYPNYEITNYLIDFLKNKNYDAESYKSFVIRSDADTLYLLVSIARGDSEYYVLVTTKNNAIVDYKEIGAIGGEDPVTFKILPNFTVEKYNGNGADATISEKLKINESGKISKQ